MSLDPVLPLGSATNSGGGAFLFQLLRELVRGDTYLREDEVRSVRRNRRLETGTEQHKVQESVYGAVVALI